MVTSRSCAGMTDAASTCAGMTDAASTCAGMTDAASSCAGMTDAASPEHYKKDKRYLSLLSTSPLVIASVFKSRA